MKPLLKYPKVRGTLSWQGNDLPFRGSITIANDGTISITTARFRLGEKTWWILEKVPGKGRLATWAKLRASTPDGLQLESDQVTMTGRNNRLGRTATTALHGELSRLTVYHNSPPAVAANCLLVYHTIGMQGFAVQETSTKLGAVRMAGVAEIEDYDHLAGRIQITADAHERQSLDEWTDASDEEIANILLIISLAEGKLLEWSIRESANGDGTLFRRDFCGPKHTGTPRDGMFHWLNLQPVLNLATSKYNEALRTRTGIDLAIRLLLAQPAHVELQLIAAMTALEHLISVYAHYYRVLPPLAKALFDDIRSALETAYDGATKDLVKDNNLAHAVLRVRGRIANMNDTTFNDRLFAMLREYQVPLVGIQDRITKAVKARHDIVHTGRHDAAFADFYLHVAVLRELLKRIILTLLGYEGQYISFLNGQEFLNFPPSTVTVIGDEAAAV
ncbi:MAG TPA: hypothetical protein VNA69_16410 [Thermoanaerobaculia bacterium]|nr:hypothetical protein [Thermoanaerobaculia bacterium]